MAEGRYLDVKKDYTTTFGELVAKYKENHRHQKSYKTKRFSIKSNLDYFGESTLLANIKYVDLETYRNHQKQKPTMHGTIREDSTVNRDVTCLRNMFTKAVEWEMVEQSPFDRENAAYRGKQSEDEISYRG